MIGMGAQAGLVEFARGCAGLKDANSHEFDPSADCPVICRGLVPFKKGAHATILTPGTRLAAVYGTDRIDMRHRHRYEMNPEYEKDLTAAGLVVSGRTEEGYIDAFELPGSKFYVGVAFQPEFESKVGHPDKLIRAFVETASRPIKK